VSATFLLLVVTDAGDYTYDIDGNRMEGFFEGDDLRVPTMDGLFDLSSDVDVDLADLSLLKANLNITAWPPPRPRSVGKMVAGAVDTEMWADVGEKLIRTFKNVPENKRHPCQIDASVYCQHAASIAACLTDHLQELHPTCQESTKTTLPYICRDDLNKSCDVAAEPIYTCLTRVKPSLAACTTALDAMKKQVADTPAAEIKRRTQRLGSMATGKALHILEGEPREMLPYAAPVVIVMVLMTMMWLSVGQNVFRALEVVQDGDRKSGKITIQNFDCPRDHLGDRPGVGSEESPRDVEIGSESDDVGDEYL